VSTGITPVNRETRSKSALTRRGRLPIR